MRKGTRIIMNKNLIVIIGPTAIGKTSLSIQLAKHFDCDIVSADSRQFYKEMKIGTAVPYPHELTEATHHYIQHKSIHDMYTVGSFENDAVKLLDQLFKTNNNVILVGGSGLYIDAVTKGLDYFPEISEDTKKNVQEIYHKNGIKGLQKQLEILDSEYYKKVDLFNPHRVMRALEVCISSKKPYSSFITQTPKKRAFKIIKIGITADRQIIYDRINQRVDNMINEGLLEEVKKLLPYKSLNALNTVGYKEIFRHLENEWTLDFAISEIKKNTRRFAKRQLTWFRKDSEITWFDYQEELDVILAYIKNHYRNI